MAGGSSGRVLTRRVMSEMSSHATIRHGRVRETIVELIREFNPDIIDGLLGHSPHVRQISRLQGKSS